MPTLHDNPETFFERGCSCKDLFSREDTVKIIEMLSSRGYQLIGLDGGIFRDNGTFEMRIDTVFSKPIVSSSEEAVRMNMLGIASVAEDPIEINAYSITVHRR